MRLNFGGCEIAWAYFQGGGGGNTGCPVLVKRRQPFVTSEPGPAGGSTGNGVTTESRTDLLSDPFDLAAKPRVRRIRIYPRMPDHQILEASDFGRSFHNLDIAIFGLQRSESLRCSQNQFRSRNAFGSGSKVWQRDDCSSPLTMRSQAFLWDVL